MRKDTKYATPRTRPPREVPIGWITALICLIMAAGLAAIILVLVKQTNDAAYAGPEKVTRHDSLDVNFTYDGEAIRWYVFIDPDTGVEYLVNDRGGCTPRLDGQGIPMGTTDKEIKVIN